MTEPQFEEYTNLYLDNEIGRNELRELKDAIRHNVLRRRKFERACELHQAARKALTARAGAAAGAREPDREKRAAASCAAVAPAQAAKPGPGRSHGDAMRAAAPRSVRQKQSQAYRNAAVATLAERQHQQGAARAVDLAGISLDSPSAAKAGGRPQIFSFFDSALGMIIGVGLTSLAAAGLFFVLKFSMPEQNDDGTLKTDAPVIHQSDVSIDQKVLLELSADQKAKSTDDAARARLYQAALTGRSASGIPSADDFAPVGNTARADAGPAGSSTANQELTVPPGLSPLTNSDPGAGGLSPSALLSAQDAATLGAGQDKWVRLSMPQLLPPIPALDNNATPMNPTTMPVTLP